MRNLALRSVLVAALALAGGCQTGVPEVEPNPALRPLTVPSGSSPADADRAALSRFVGVWNFEGWWGSGDGRKQVAGSAAGVIENEHFVLLDLRATSGTGRGGRKAGSMLLASEPGIGLTLTAWGDASPAITRFVGDAQGDGSVFTFTEARTPSGVHRTALKITFENDDRWTAEVRDDTASGDPVIASYRFTRASP